MPTEISYKALNAVIPAFLGVRLQRPPGISAVRVDGRRAHKLARAGLEPDIQPRPVAITAIENITHIGPGLWQMLVRCHKGTYIRSLARDIGRALGTGAHLTALRRLYVGSYNCETALPFEPHDYDVDFRDEAFRGEKERAQTIVAQHVRPVTSIADQYTCYAANAFCEKRLLSGLGVWLDFLSFRNAGVVPASCGIMVLSRNWLSLTRLESRDGRAILYPQANMPLATVCDDPVHVKKSQQTQSATKHRESAS